MKHVDLEIDLEFIVPFFLWEKRSTLTKLTTLTNFDHQFPKEKYLFCCFSANLGSLRLPRHLLPEHIFPWPGQLAAFGGAGGVGCSQEGSSSHSSLQKLHLFCAQVSVCGQHLGKDLSGNQHE